MSDERKKRRLLIVEDEPDLLEIMVEFCSSLTSQIQCAQDGVEALEILQSSKIDAVLSDINMPKKSGLQLLAELRSSGFETPFIFLSGYSDRDNVAQALKLGATDFIEKPFEQAKLLSVVDSALDLGAALNNLEVELEDFYKNSKLAPEKLQQVKNARKEIWKMKGLDPKTKT